MKRRRTIRRPRPPTGLIQAHIETFSHDCRGIARIEGKASFIQDALPGEEVEFRYTNMKRDYSEGLCTKVLTASPIRVEPKCPHVNLCGGCSLQHMDVSEQIKAKQDILINLFQRVGRLKPETLMSPLTAESWNYRNKARLSVRYVNKKNSAMVGFREKNNPKFITDIEGCSILNSKVDGDIIHLRNLINSLEARHSIAQIEVAAGDTEVALILRNLTPLISSDEEKLRLFAEQFKYRMFLQPDDADSIYAFYPPDQSDFLSYELPHHQLTLHFHPNDFIQVNAPLNRLMVDQAIQLMAIEPEDTVLDLFCGLGNFSLPLAKYCSKVTGVEGSQAMVERARMNAKLNQLDNTAFHLANLDDAQQVETLLNYQCNKLLIDPPRSGALEVVRMMNKLSPERIVYISCNPVTLARDADILVNQHGYQLKAAGVMDMFPNTSHVESIALFVKG